MNNQKDNQINDHENNEPDDHYVGGACCVEAYRLWRADQEQQKTKGLNKDLQQDKTVVQNKDSELTVERLEDASNG